MHVNLDLIKKHLNQRIQNEEYVKSYSQIKNSDQKISLTFFTHSDLFFKYNSYATSKYKPLTKKELFNYIFTFLNDYDLRELKNAPEESWVTLLATRVLYRFMLNTVLRNRVTILFWEGRGLRSHKEARGESTFIESEPNTGHIALKTYRGGSEGDGHYISYYPKKSSCNCGEKKRFESHHHTLKEDLLENVTPKKIHLQTLNIEAINTYYEKLREGLTFWEALSGSINGDWDESYHTCASLTYKLLQKGGIEELTTTHVNEYYKTAGVISSSAVGLGTLVFLGLNLFHAYINLSMATLNINSIFNAWQTMLMLYNIQRSYLKSLMHIEKIKGTDSILTCKVDPEAIKNKIVDFSNKINILNPVVEIAQNIESINKKTTSLWQQKLSFNMDHVLELNALLVKILGVTDESQKILLSLDTSEIEEIELFNDKIEQNGADSIPYYPMIKHHVKTITTNMKLSQGIYQMMSVAQMIFLGFKGFIGLTIGGATYLSLKVIYSIPTPGGVANFVMKAANEEKKIAMEQNCEKHMILKKPSVSHWKPIKNLAIKIITLTQYVFFGYVAYKSWKGRFFI